MPQQETPKYTGKLAEKLPAPKPVDAPPSDGGTVDTRLVVAFELALLEWEHSTELESRMALLFDHFGIPQPATGHEIDSWQGLAKALAARHVPGFQHTAPLGPSKRWGEWQIVRLYIDVTILTREHNHGVSWACERLASKDPWKSFGRPGASQDSRGKTLRRKFYAIKKQGHRIVGIVDRDIRNFPDEIDDKLRLASDAVDFLNTLQLSETAEAA